MSTRSRPEDRDPALAAQLRSALDGDVRFSSFDRARYATDASLYQIQPLGVVRPRHTRDVEATLSLAREAGVSVLPRGGGTSQAGQTVGRSLVIDTSRWLTGVHDLDVEARTVWVEPGIVLDELNSALRPHGLFYPVDVSTSSRATLGGMTANNSCGSRSLRYGVSVDNVLAIDALKADGTVVRFDEVRAGGNDPEAPMTALTAWLEALAAREAGAIAAGMPKTARQVGGYALDRIVPGGSWNPVSLLVGSEGTLAYFTRIKLKLWPLPRHKVMGVCHFPSFRGAMEAAPHLVTLGPTCVELVDRSILDLASRIPTFARSMDRFVRGRPEALLLVEFVADSAAPLAHELRRLDELMGELGHSGAVVEAHDGDLIGEITALRTAGLNIAMSMKGDAKPVSFIEDCAVPVEHLADYTDAVTDLFRRHGTTGTWYAHAAVGCLHVRPILNLKQDEGVTTMRAIAEEAVELVKRFDGSHSGEHGDGLVRSEWHERVFGQPLVQAFEAVKDRFDPNGSFNTAPSKIVRAPKFDDHTLLRQRPNGTPPAFAPALDWSAWGGLLGAAEMCNNNGACRKSTGDVMCPSFRATRDERDVTRGRANVLRQALTGELGPDALTSVAMREAMSLCVGCKACKRECPTGVDMARMKIELQNHWRQRTRLAARDRLIAYLPRYAGVASRYAWLPTMRDRVPGLAKLSEWVTGLRADRALPIFRRRPNWASTCGDERPAVVLFGDTFNAWFEPENLLAARQLIEAAGHRAIDPTPPGERPLCCGRTFLAAGLVDEARAELERTLRALRPHLDAGTPIVGLEPSCLLTFRDEAEALLPAAAYRAIEGRTRLLADWLLTAAADPRFRPRWNGPRRRVVIHGHCHEKAFGVFESVTAALRLDPMLDVDVIDSSCCGMAGAFGYQVEHRVVSQTMAEASLLPRVRDAAATTLIVANGTSCRQQIAAGSDRQAQHLAVVLADRLA
ncbi:MAG: FAD-binding and (Fe-S)-binding domain-containing protein [Pseudomonadota bacterium]